MSSLNRNSNASNHYTNQLATEKTLWEVKKSIDNIQLNVGDIAIGDVLVSGEDQGTHERLTNTNLKLDTLHNDLSSIDDKLNNDPILTDALQVSIKNESIVVDPINNSINKAPYDLIINGATLWADSTPAGNPFFADPNGREGWYYDNLSNVSNTSNIYWYGNPTSGNLQENDMTFSQLSGMYCIITCDYVENGSLTIPTMAIFSQPTGTNDFIPTFAHSRWVYQLSALNRSKLRKGETLLLYTGSTRPNVHINIPSYQLSLVSVNGDALSSEIIAYMSVNTQSTTSKIGYLLLYCGYLNSAIGFNREYSFKNSKERLGEDNISKLKFTGDDLKAVVSNTGFNCNNIANTPLITGFALETGGNLATVATNTDKLKFVGDDLKAVVSNTGFNCNNIANTPLITGFALETGGNLSTVATNTDKLKFVGDDLKAVVSNTGFNCNNIANTPLITGFALETGGNLATVATNTDKLKFVGDDLKAVVSNTGFNCNNIANTPLITGFALETGGNLSTVATKSTSIDNKINNDVVNTQAIQVQVKNSSLTVDTGLNLSSLSTSALQTTGNSKLDTINTSIGTTNTKLDTIHSDLDGLTFDGSSNLNVNINAGSLTVDSVKIQASNGDILTATSGSLNTNITNTILSVNATNEGFKVLDSNGNAIGGTNALLIEGMVDINTTTPLNISGTVVSHTQGYDPNTATYNDIYADIDGVQRVEVVESHIISAKYVIEQDVNIIAKLVTNPSTNSNAYSVDTRGREGWHFDNINPTTGIASGANTLDWYKSTISTPPALTIQKLQALYAIICFDKLPLNAFHSYFVVTTTASTWFYYNPLSQIPNIYPGETYLLYYGTKAYQHFPEIQNASKLEMIRVLNIGPGDVNETITNIQLLNIDESALNVYSYLISECGLYDQDRQNWFQVYFRNIIDFDANANLSNLTLTGNNLNVNITNSSIPVTGNFYQNTQPVSIASTVPVSISATINTNITNSSLTVSDTTSQGFLNTINQGIGYAYIEAIAINSATVVGTGSATFFTWTRGQYRRTVFNHVDSAISNTDSISILTKDSLGNGIIIATFFPYVVAGIRQFSGILELSPFNAISIRNNSSSSISAVTLKIFSA